MLHGQSLEVGTRSWGPDDDLRLGITKVAIGCQKRNSAEAIDGKAIHVGTVTTHQRERFEAKIRRYDDPRRCWLWTGAKSSTGYGNFAVADHRTQSAHRVAYQLFVGRIPAGRVVLHRCHRPLCMNPRHLYLGTHAIKSRATAQRLRVGTRKLSPKDVRAIKQAYRGGELQRAIARRYGVAQTTIRAVCQHRSWRWIGLKAVKRRRNRKER